jgi:4-hydroxybenzoate polyprenyltransferase
MFRRIRYILEMIRFSHTLFALPFALLAAVMAWSRNAHQTPPVHWRWTELAGIICCMVAARSAAMAFNRIVDVRIDAENPRTQNRHLPAGLLSRGSVIAFAAVASAAFVASTLLFLPNRLPLYLALPVLALLLGYSYAKRFTVLAHFWLGLALMLAPVSAWIAIRGQFVLANAADLLPALILGAAVLLWVAGFDIIYACQDVDFDRRQGLSSVPARWGVARALHIAALCHAGMVALLALLPMAYNRLADNGFGWLYWAGWAAVAGLLVHEHRLVRPDDLTRVNRAFFNMNIVVSVGLFLVGAADLALMH